MRRCGYPGFLVMTEKKYPRKGKERVGDDSRTIGVGKYRNLGTGQGLGINIGRLRSKRKNGGRDFKNAGGKGGREKGRVLEGLTRGVCREHGCIEGVKQKRPGVGLYGGRIIL